MAAQPQKDISNLIGTPGAVLRSVDVPNADMSKVAEVLMGENIRYLFVIGNASAIDFCRKANAALKKENYELRLMLVPISMDNDIPLTDHCLGYGSVAKHLALLGKAIVADVRSMQTNGAVTIIEVKDCDNEWLLASLALARYRKENGEAPHLVILSQFDGELFVKNVNNTLRNIGNCVVVVGSKLVNGKGENLVEQKAPGQYLKSLLETNFDVQIDVVPLHDWRLTSNITLSDADVRESALCAQKAVELAITVGITGKMVTLLRADDSKYSSEVNCVDLDSISDKKKAFPEGWYISDDMVLDVPFYKYAMPLIVGERSCQFENGLPVFSKLK